MAQRAAPVWRGGRGQGGKREPRGGAGPARLLKAQVVPDEDSVPARLLGLGGQARDDRGVSQRIE